MPKMTGVYRMTDSARTRFKVWLIKHDLSLVAFAKKCGCSRQYIEQILKGKKAITPNVREKFKNGGYDLL